MPYQKYVVGLLFRNDFKEVVLLHKNRPAWQKGFMNGVGGKVEPGETVDRAMMREFVEEAGVLIDHWVHFACTRWAEGEVHYFAAELGCRAEIRSVTDEPVDWVLVSDLPKLPLIENLKWAIPMAITRLTKETFYADIVYGTDPLAKQIAGFTAKEVPRA